MDRYRFVLLRYLICLIKTVSPNAKIIDHEIDDESCQTSREVAGSLDILSIIATLKNKGWDFSGSNEIMEAIVIRNGLECKLAITFRWFDGVPSFCIHTFASPHTE